MSTKQVQASTLLNDISFDEEGFLWMKPKGEIEMDLEEVRACFNCYREMGIGKGRKVLQIIDARENVSMSKEARDFVAANGEEYFIASAVLSDNLPVRLLVNFFNTFYKSSKVPLKVFDKESSAKEWLKTFL
jgi:hypothetical protein